MTRDELRRLEVLCELRGLTPDPWDLHVAHALQHAAYNAAWRDANHDAQRDYWQRRKADPVRYGAKKRQNAARMREQYAALEPAEKAAHNRAKYAAVKACPARMARKRELDCAARQRVRLKPSA